MVWRRVKYHWLLYVLLILPVTYYIMFRYYPILLQLIIAFKSYSLIGGVWGSRWVGFDNFHHLFAKPDFIQVLRNTVIISLMRLVYGFWPPLLLAIMLFDLRSAIFRRISQTILYIPHFFSWVIVYAITYAMLSNLGLINQMIHLISGHTVNFLLSERWFRTILVVSGVWKEIGWGTIIYLAGLSALDPSTYEAARMDGAGPMKRIWYITLPGLAPIIVFLFTIQLGHILHAGGEQVLIYYNPVTYSVGDIIDTWVYRQGLAQLQYSLATAMSLFQSLFGLMLVVAANKLARKYAGTGIW